jgi:hypothetical protein
MNGNLETRDKRDHPLLTSMSYRGIRRINSLAGPLYHRF